MRFDVAVAKASVMHVLHGGAELQEYVQHVARAQLLAAARARAALQLRHPLRQRAMLCVTQGRQGRAGQDRDVRQSIGLLTPLLKGHQGCTAAPSAFLNGSGGGSGGTAHAQQGQQAYREGGG